VTESGRPELRPLRNLVGHWRRRWIAAAQAAYVDAWQAAWREGCAAGFAGEPARARPYRLSSQSEAWMAGWSWGHAQPDRRNRTRLDPNWAARRRHQERRRSLMRVAKGGVFSVAVVAVATWVLRSNAPKTTAPRDVAP
jgi:hypothetical protein